MVRVLLTGFGPFPGAPVNPSAWLAETLPSRLSEGDEEVDARILPTEWEAVAELTEQLRETLQPHVSIHFGLSHHAKGFRIERSAHNREPPRRRFGRSAAQPRHPPARTWAALHHISGNSACRSSQPTRHLRRPVALGGKLPL